jgi:hypothetical protein
VKFTLDIKSNAIDSFNEALAKYEEGVNGDIKSFKFAISHLSHSVELVLKMYLQKINEKLIYTKCYKEVEKRAKRDKSSLLHAAQSLTEEHYDFDKLLNKHPNPHTVTVDQVLNIAKSERCGVTGVNFVDQEFLDDIAWMKGLRNSIEHYEFEYTAKEVRMCTGRLVRALDEFTDIFSLFKLEDEIGKEKYHVFEELVDEYEHALREAKLDVVEEEEKVFAGTRMKERLFIDWKVYTCESCGNNTMIPNGESGTGYRCTFTQCGNEQSGEILVDCDICASSWPNEQMVSWEDTYENVCPACNSPDDW